MTKEEIGRVLKQLRIASGKTQAEVAEILGRKQQIIGHWETGYSQPDANTLFELCDLYGTSVDIAFGVGKRQFNITTDESRIIKQYRALDSQGRDAIHYTLNKEAERMSQIDDANAHILRLEAELAEHTKNSPTVQ